MYSLDCVDDLAQMCGLEVDDADAGVEDVVMKWNRREGFTPPSTKRCIVHCDGAGDPQWVEHHGDGGDGLVVPTRLSWDDKKTSPRRRTPAAAATAAADGASPARMTYNSSLSSFAPIVPNPRRRPGAQQQRPSYPLRLDGGGGSPRRPASPQSASDPVDAGDDVDRVLMELEDFLGADQGQEHTEGQQDLAPRASPRDNEPRSSAEDDGNNDKVPDAGDEAIAKAMATIASFEATGAAPVAQRPRPSPAADDDVDRCIAELDELLAGEGEGGGVGDGEDAAAPAPAPALDDPTGCIEEAFRNMEAYEQRKATGEHVASATSPPHNSGRKRGRDAAHADGDVSTAVLPHTTAMDAVVPLIDPLEEPAAAPLDPTPEAPRGGEEAEKHDADATSSKRPPAKRPRKADLDVAIILKAAATCRRSTTAGDEAATGLKKDIEKGEPTDAAPCVDLDAFPSPHLAGEAKDVEPQVDEAPAAAKTHKKKAKPQGDADAATDGEAKAAAKAAKKEKARAAEKAETKKTAGSRRGPRKESAPVVKEDVWASAEAQQNHNPTSALLNMEAAVQPAAGAKKQRGKRKREHDVFSLGSIEGYKDAKRRMPLRTVRNANNMAHAVSLKRKDVNIPRPRDKPLPALETKLTTETLAKQRSLLDLAYVNATEPSRFWDMQRLRSWAQDAFCLTPDMVPSGLC